MQEGYYWVESATTEPEVWYYAGEHNRQWFGPGKKEPLDADAFAGSGYRIISNRLSLT